MKVTDILALSTRMFKARKLRTFLTVLGMGVGIGAILFLVSLGYGLQKTLLERITTADSLLSLDVSQARADLVPLDGNTISEMRSMSEVQEVSPGVQFTAQGVFGETLLDLSVFATDPTFFKLGGIRPDKGSGLDDGATDSLILSSSLAEVFQQQAEGEVLGKEIRVTLFRSKTEGEDVDPGKQEAIILEPIGGERRYVIRGVLPSEENLAYIHINSIGDVPLDVFSRVKVKIRDEKNLPIVRDRIIEKGFLVSALSDTVDQANKIFGIIQIVLLSFGVIALVVSAIGMFNTMTIALLERTEEIGIMKSIGASDTDISLLFVIESALMGFLGGFGGVIIGYAGGLGLNTLINFLAVRLGGEAVDLFYSPPWFVGMIIIFAAVVGFLTGFFPARRASRIDPLDALRYK